MSIISPINRAFGAGIRGFHARIVTPLRLRWLAKIYGFQHALDAIGRLPMAEIPDALRLFGATIGEKAHIFPGLRFENAGGHLRNLKLGDNVYIGSGVLLDLTSPIVMHDHAGIAPYACIITHLSVGDRPTQDSYPTVTAGVTLEEGCVVGTGVVILHGVTVGRNAAISAGSVVHRSIPPFTVMTGVPARYAGEIPDRSAAAAEELPPIAAAPAV